MNLIKEFRQKANLSQGDLAKKMQVDLQFVSNIERQIAPIPAKHFKVINKSIGVPIKRLMNYNVERYITRMKLEMKRN